MQVADLEFKTDRIEELEEEIEELTNSKSEIDKQDQPEQTDLVAELQAKI